MAADGVQDAAVAAVEAKSSSVSFSSFKAQFLVDPSKASDAVNFFKVAFGAEELYRTVHPKRKADEDHPLLVSSELKLGDAVFSVISDLSGNSDAAARSVSEAAGLVLYLETDDVEGAVAKAVGAGAVAVGEVTKGESAGRVGRVKDPFGFVWVISSPVEVAEA